jgi:hypothetical protein
MVEAVSDRSNFFRHLAKTVAFGLTLGVLTAVIIISMELMWQAFAGSVAWSLDAFTVQSILIFLAITMTSGALYAIIVKFRADLIRLLIGDLIAGAVMGATTYILLLISSVEYAGTMINLGFNGAHETGPAYYLLTFLGPFLFLALIGAIATSAGAITCRSAIIRGRPTGNDLKNAALGTIGLVALIIVAPPLAALALSSF